MISVSDTLQIHKTLIELFGGSHGLRDRSLLEAALHRPYSTFDGKDLYSTPIEKAACLLESIVTNHPFVDGNKRTGYVLMQLTLLNYGQILIASQEEKYDLVISVSKGEIKYERILNWLQEKIKENDS